jgi:hypothetical protein
LEKTRVQIKMVTASKQMEVFTKNQARKGGVAMAQAVP